MAAVPTDRGWAWLTVLGTFINQIFVVGGARSFGIIFVHMMEHFQSSSTAAAWSVALMCFGLSLYSPLASFLGQRYSFRLVTMLGAAAQGLAFFLSAFSNSIYFTALMIGIIDGFAVAFLFTPSISVVGQYFVKRRSLAMGLSAAGTSIGQLIIPLLIRFLLDEYGYFGCMLIYGAVTWNCLVSSSLFSPISYYTKHQHVPKESKPADDALKVHDFENINVMCNVNAIQLESRVRAASLRGLDQDNGPKRTSSQNNIQINEDYVPESTSVDVIKSRHNDHRNEDSMLFQTEGLHNFPSESQSLANQRINTNESSNNTESMENDININPTETDNENSNEKSIYSTDPPPDVEAASESKTGCDNALCNMFREMFDVEILSRGMFISYTVAVLLANTAVLMLYVLLPPFAKEIGIDKSKVAMILSIGGFSDLAGKIFGAVFNNLQLIQTRHFMGLSITVLIIVTSVYLFIPCFASMLAHGIALGMFGGMYIGQFAYFLLEFIGPKKFASALALTMTAVGMANLVLPLIAGAVFDAVGSYIIPLWMCVIMLLVATILFETLPLVNKLDKKREKT